MIAQMSRNNGKARAITTDHTPYLNGERQRIIAAGGVVSAFPDEPPAEVSGKGRLFVKGEQFPGLALSRAFGDLIAKQVYTRACIAFRSSAGWRVVLTVVVIFVFCNDDFAIDSVLVCKAYR